MLLNDIAIIINELCDYDTPKRIAPFLEQLSKLNIPLIHLNNKVKDSKPNRYYIIKKTDNGFLKTELNDILTKLGINSVILMGKKTKMSMETTATDAYFNGYNVIIAKDAIISDNPDDLQSIYEWFELYFGVLMTCDEILTRINDYGYFETKEVEIP